MAINTPNPGVYLQTLTNEVIALRDAFDNLVNANAYLTSIGGAAFLTSAAPTGPALSVGDAAALVATLGNLSNLATQYNGGVQAAALNYRANSTPLWSGQ